MKPYRAPPFKPKLRKTGRQIMRDGEPFRIYLRRWEYDNALRGQTFMTCCDCGLTHFETLEAYQQRDGSWWLTRRAYRDIKHAPKVKKRKRQ